MTRISRLRAAAALLLAASNVTCADLFTEPGAIDVAVTLAADSTIVVGGTVRAIASATSAGAPLADARFALESSDSSIIAVRGTDSLVAKARGAADVTVRLVSSLLPGDAPTVTQRIRVVVGAVVAESSAVTFASIGDTLRVAAVGLDAEGSLVAALPRWQSSDTGLVRVDSLTGRMTARSNGTAAVIARLDDKADTVAVTVQQVLDRYTFNPAAVFLDALAATQVVTATGRDARGNAMAGVPPTFAADDPSIVQVGAATGAVTSLLNGQTVVRATRGGVVDSFAVTVAQRATSVFIQPRPVPPVTSLGSQVQLSVRAFDRNAVEIQGATPAWFTLDPQRVTVTSGGLLTALAVGSARVIAALGGVTDTSDVTITDDPALITVTPDTASASTVGDTVVFTAVVANGIGGTIPNPGVAWRTPDSTIARVLNDGRAITQGTGFARVIAQAGTKADTGFLVSTNQVAYVDIAVGFRTLPVPGATDTPAVDVRNARSAPLPRTSVAWSSDDPLIARVSALGVVTAVDTGQVYIRATAGFFRDSVLYTVQNLALVTVLDITPISRTLTSLGAADTPAVDFRNGFGAAVPRNAVTWSSDDQVIARVSSQGVVTALDTGQTYIRVTSGTLTDSVLYVLQNVPVSIVISGRGLDTLAALGQSFTYTADVRNGRNAPMTQYAVAWRSTDTNQVRVDTAGGVASATATGFGTGVALIAQAGAVADTVLVVPRNLTRILVDNSVVVIGTRTGTTLRPYAKIQDAVNAADANDTVFVRRGTGAYSETVALSRRLYLFGDSGSVSAAGTFLGSARNPSFLPVIGHDTGTAAITAITTAPQTIRYLVVRHTLDGPAIHADGSDATVEWFYVNPPGTVSSRVGRGVSLRNSPSGTVVRNVRIRSVRGYGIRLEAVSGATISSDSIIGIDSLAGQEPGSGIYVIGGSNATISANVVRQAQGPQINVRGATSPVVSSNNLASKNTLVRYDSVQGSPRITFNTFDTRFQTGDDGQNSAQDDRAALQLFNSAPPPRLFISFNTFQGASFNFMDAIYIVNSSEWFVESNTFRWPRYAIRTNGVGTGFITRNATDSGSVYIYSEGDDALLMYDDTVRNIESGCVQTFGANPNINITTSLLQNCAYLFGPHAVRVGSGSSSSALAIRRSRIDARARMALGVSFTGGFARIDTTEVLLTDTTAVSNYPFDSTLAAVNLNGSNVSVNVNGTRIAGFTRHPGLALPTSGSFQVQRSVFTQNRVGFESGNATYVSTTLNDVFDNRTAGFNHRGGLASLPNGFWWGDDRGPRSGAVPLATGDSIAGPVLTVSALAAPLNTGTTAAAVRHVRGTGQTAARATVAPKRLTVRVVDVNGRPVSGVGVTFTVTGGGGNIGGSSSSAVSTDGDGLAEVTFTLGPAAGTNTVAASGTSVSIGTVNFTLTGT